ncbi:MAG: hypothetical protein ACTSWV_03240, partial [Candidatus Asgardarchaeia archaeon]
NFSFEYSRSKENFIFSITVKGRRLKNVLKDSESILNEVSKNSILRSWKIEDPINVRYSFYTPILYDLEGGFIEDERFYATHFSEFPDRQNLNGCEHFMFLFRRVLREDLDKEIDRILKKMEGLGDEKRKIKLLIAMRGKGGEKVLDEKERESFKRIIDLSREDSCIGLFSMIKRSEVSQEPRYDVKYAIRRDLGIFRESSVFSLREVVKFFGSLKDR